MVLRDVYKNTEIKEEYRFLKHEDIQHIRAVTIDHNIYYILSDVLEALQPEEINIGKCIKLTIPFTRRQKALYIKELEEIDEDTKEVITYKVISETGFFKLLLLTDTKLGLQFRTELLNFFIDKSLQKETNNRYKIKKVCEWDHMTDHSLLLFKSIDIEWFNSPYFQQMDIYSIGNKYYLKGEDLIVSIGYASNVYCPKLLMETVRFQVGDIITINEFNTDITLIDLQAALLLILASKTSISEQIRAQIGNIYASNFNWNLRNMKDNCEGVMLPVYKWKQRGYINFTKYNNFLYNDKRFLSLESTIYNNQIYFSVNDIFDKFAITAPTILPQDTKIVLKVHTGNCKMRLKFVTFGGLICLLLKKQSTIKENIALMIAKDYNNIHNMIYNKTISGK